MIEFYPAGGLGEIGMNCAILATGSGESETRVMVDCGVQFSDLRHLGIEFMIPDFPQLLADQRPQAVFLTHAHEDHIGAVPYLIRSGYSGPIYGTTLTLDWARRRLEEQGLASNVQFFEMTPGQSFEFGAWSVRPVLVNHSIPDAVGLSIETPEGLIVHTGDFKLDSDPVFAEPFDPVRFNPSQRPIKLLLSDSTNASVHRDPVAETSLDGGFDRCFSNCSGLGVVTLFSSNLARLKQIIESAGRHGRKVCLGGKSLVSNFASGVDLGFLEKADHLVDFEQFVDLPRSKGVLLVPGCQGEYRSALSRLANGEFKGLSLEEGDQVFFSSRSIPGNEKAIGRLINKLARRRVGVVTPKEANIHVSGHAADQELLRVLKTLRPEYFIPVHGETRHLLDHLRLAEQAGVNPQKMVMVENGEGVRIRDRIKVEERKNDIICFVGSHNGPILDKQVVNERRKLVQAGVVIAAVQEDENDPSLFSYGAISSQHEEEFLKQVQHEARREFSDAWDSFDHSAEPATENLRIALARSAQNVLARRPFVVAVGNGTIKPERNPC